MDLTPESTDIGEPAQSSAEPTLAQIMSVNQDSKSTLTAQMETIQIDFSLLKQDVQNLWDRTGATENCTSPVEDTLTPLFTTVQEATSELAALWGKVNDLENGSRRNNLRYVGFPEKCEGANPRALPAHLAERSPGPRPHPCLLCHLACTLHSSLPSTCGGFTATSHCSYPEFMRRSDHPQSCEITR